MTDSIRIDTPESVDLALEPAGLGSRFLAAVVDGLIQAAGVFLILMIFVPTGLIASDTDLFAVETLTGIVFSILLLLLAFLFFGYKLILETFWNGQTLGKRVAGIRVIRANGMPAGFLQVLIRNLLRPVDYFPSNYILGAIVILATARNQRLGDIAAGTVVVRARQAGAPVVPVELSHPPQVDLTKLRELVMRLREEDLEAARGYWERRNQFDAEARFKVAVRIMEGLATKMGWTDPLPPFPDHFIEEVLYVRAR